MTLLTSADLELALSQPTLTHFWAVQSVDEGGSALRVTLLKHWLQNVKDTLKWWADHVEPESVNLEHWRTNVCGMTACFGGWMAAAGHLGVRSSGTGAPYLGEYISATDSITKERVAYWLFGDHELFSSLTDEELEAMEDHPESASFVPNPEHYATVVSRLEDRERQLELEIEELGG